MWSATTVIEDFGLYAFLPLNCNLLLVIVACNMIDLLGIILVAAAQSSQLDYTHVSGLCGMIKLVTLTCKMQYDKLRLLLI